MAHWHLTFPTAFARLLAGAAFILAGLGLAAPSAQADPLRAVTEDGRQVMLEEDGRWRFLEDDGTGVTHRLALSVSTIQDVPSGCRVTMHLVNLSADEAIENFTPRVAFWRSGRLTPMREVVRFRAVAERGTQDIPIILRFVPCKDLQRLEIPTLQDTCSIGGNRHEDFECLEWTRPDPGALPITLG